MLEGSKALDVSALRAAVHDLAREDVFVGTSSWKYPGWLGQLYEPDRYVYRGKFSQTRFDRQCLEEYGSVFRTVSVDAAYYQFPTEKYARGLADAVPDGFEFGFKVTDDITVKRFPRLPRFGDRGGQVNPFFLSPEVLVRDFLNPLETIRPKVGVLIFEFSKFYPADFARGRDFVEALDGFLGRLPAGWRYAVEIRNASFLHPEYFAMLNRHNVAHVFNSWTAMPPIGEQFEMAGAVTADHMVARLLLRPGRKFEEAVQAFQPYEDIKDPYPEAIAIAARILLLALRHQPRKKTYLYVNNRLEGSALKSILRIIAKLKEFQA